MPIPTMTANRPGPGGTGRTRARRILLWRHGRTAWNVENRAQGQADVPLDAVGEQQARWAADRLAPLGVDAILSSDLQRAARTAEELAARTGVPVRIDARLREVHVGIRQGLTATEFRAQHPEVFARFHEDPAYTIPEAENPADAGRRVAGVVRDVMDTLPAGGLAVLVGHGAALRHGLLDVLGAPEHLHHLFAGMDNCAVTVLTEHESEGWQLSQYNTHEVQAAAVRNVDDQAADQPDARAVDAPDAQTLDRAGAGSTRGA